MIVVLSFFVFLAIGLVMIGFILYWTFAKRVIIDINPSQLKHQKRILGKKVKFLFIIQGLALPIFLLLFSLYSSDIVGSSYLKIKHLSLAIFAIAYNFIFLINVTLYLKKKILVKRLENNASSVVTG